MTVFLCRPCISASAVGFFYLLNCVLCFLPEHVFLCCLGVRFRSCLSISAEEIVCPICKNLASKRQIVLSLKYNDDISLLMHQLIISANWTLCPSCGAVSTACPCPASLLSACPLGMLKPLQVLKFKNINNRKSSKY